jgi:hypothetical protein
VAHPDYYREAHVLECWPGNNDPAVILSDGGHLPRDHKIKIIARYVRGELVFNPGATFVNMQHIVLDKSRNGKVDVPTLAAQLGKIYNAAMAEVAAVTSAAPEETKAPAVVVAVEAANAVAKPATPVGQAATTRTSKRKSAPNGNATLTIRSNEPTARRSTRSKQS